jgi:hypothetical protein
MPPAGGWKSSRTVSIRPDVQLPAAPRMALMCRVPPVWRTLAVVVGATAIAGFSENPAQRSVHQETPEHIKKHRRNRPNSDGT